MAALLFLMPLLAGCDVQDQAMRTQKKFVTYAPADLWHDGSSARPLPEHTIATSVQTDEPPPVTPALIQRGRERYEIYCTPCHGFDGQGNGVVVQRGFPRPPAYTEPRLLQADARHFYDVITNGYGVMYPYRARVAPADRWAIVAYIRALQQATKAADQRGAPHP